MKNKIAQVIQTEVVTCTDGEISAPAAFHVADVILSLIDFKEICICAAVRATDGTIVRGQRHADAIHTCIEKGKDMDIHKGYDGFITSTGRFVDRFEGYRLQVEAGIESIAKGGYRGVRLFSEDLY